MDLNPPPLFPPLINRPLSLIKSDDTDVKITIAKRFRESIRNSPYYIITRDTEKSNFNATIERFSDKYSKQKLNATKWTPIWSRLPKELKYFNEKSDLPSGKTIKKTRETQKTKTKQSKTIDLKKIVDLNKTKFETGDIEAEEEEVVEDGEEKEKREGEDETEGEEELENVEDEEIEEENDYIDAYFDNGENDFDDDYGGGGDDEGPVY